MAEAIAAIGASESASEAAKVASQTGREAIKLASKVEEEVHERAYAAFKRKGDYFDYEKVFWNSLFGSGLFVLGYGSIKLGELLAGIIVALDDITNWLPGMGGLISDESRQLLFKTNYALQYIDNKITGIVPIVPAAIVAGNTVLEFRRIRENLDENTRKIGDVATVLGAAGAAFVGLRALNPPEQTVTTYLDFEIRQIGLIQSYVGVGVKGSPYEGKRTWPAVSTVDFCKKLIDQFYEGGGGVG